jgi:hypothetical protein
VHLSPSGLWTYTTRWDTILRAALPKGKFRAKDIDALKREGRQ